MSSGSRAGCDERDVQGLEVVPDVLDLRPPRHGEAEPAEEVDQLVGRLGQRVAMAELGPVAGQGDVDRVDAPIVGRSTRALAASKAASMRLLRGVEPLAVGLLGRRFERLEPLLGRLEPTLLLAEELDPRGLDGLGRPPRRGTRPGRRLQGVEVGQGVVDRGWRCSWSGQPLGVTDGRAVRGRRITASRPPTTANGQFENA